MKKVALAALSIGLVGLFAACGGGGSGDDTGDDTTDRPDARPPPDVNELDLSCEDPMANDCPDNYKCTWIRITEDLGQLGCVPEGDVPTGAQCTVGELGQTTGYDDCEATNICIGGICESICLLADGSGCDETTSCSRYSRTFANGTDVPPWGACDFKCDAVTQSRTFDGEPYCGSADPGAPDRGCFVVFDRQASCARVPVPARELEQDDQAYGPSPTTAYLNGCSAGYGPLLRAANDAAAPVICMAYCRPGPTHSGATANSAGLVGSPYRCPNRGATNHECRYFWWWEDYDGDTLHARHAHEALGYCWTPANYLADWFGTGEDVPFPACTSLANVDEDDNGFLEHAEWGCDDYPYDQAGVAPARKPNKLPFRAPRPGELEMRDWQ
jgi:hypothetical protein